MKHLLSTLLITAFLFLSTGCKKTDKDLAPDPSGRWEASKDIGGTFVGSEFIPGNGNIFEFESNRFKIFQTGTLTDSGFYTLIKEPYEYFSHRLILNNNYTSRYFLTIDNGNLIIANDGMIPTVRLYLKIP